MAHYGLLREYRFSDEVDDIRGATLYGTDDEKIGKIDDVIFDHSSGTIQYAVVDAGGWLSTKKFLVPADRIRSYGAQGKDFSIDMTKDAVRSLPEYDEKAVENDKEWDKYNARYREAVETGPVMHKEGSTHILTPEPEDLPAGTGSGVDDRGYGPKRIADVFPEAAANPGKTRLRPSGIAARAEDSAAPGAHVRQEIPTAREDESLGRRQPRPAVTIPDRWNTFEDHLRRNRVDITANCGSCATAKDRVA
jgi:sporulation protein YlmC with PRC-barrel domain